MKRKISFGEISQFRNTIKAMATSAQYIGYDEINNKALFDNTIKLPIIKATASEKIHGSNGAVCYSNSTGFYVQKRKEIITPEKDNAGCAFHAEQNKEHWLYIIKQLVDIYNIDLDESIVSVFFEWCGGGVQKKSAVSGLDKRAIIFQHFKVSPLKPDKEIPSKWFETKYKNNWVALESYNIFNVMNYKHWDFEIDFENPTLSQNSFIELVDIIEKESPLGKAMGKEGNIGEGIVISFLYKDTLQRFKVKGTKHSDSKVKVLKPVDEVKEQAKIDFVNNHACPAFRLEQAWQEVFGIENEKRKPEIKAMGDFLRLVIKDVLKEESDILNSMGLEPKEVNSKISKVARGWFLEQLKKEDN